VGILKVKPDPPPGPKLKLKDAPQEPPATPQAAAEIVKAEQPVQTRAVTRKTKPDRTVEETIADVPQALEIEMALLGAMINEPQNTIAQAALMLRVDSFASPVHGKIFQALCDMWDSGSKLDLVTFSQYLEDTKIADEVGGRQYVTQLVRDTSGAAFIDDYSKIIREKYLFRRMIRHAFALAGAAQKQTDRGALDVLTSFAGSYGHLLEEGQGMREIGFYDAAHLLNGELPVKPPQVVHHVLYQGSKMILGGTSKARKTWVLMALALAVSTGTPWWGFHTTKRRVCYVNLELPHWAFHERLQLIAKQLGVKPEEGWLRELNLRGHALSIEELRRRYSLMLKSGHFGFLILDPMYKLLGHRDENKAGDIASLCNEVDRIADETGAAIAFAGHFSKGNQSQKESIDRISGSGVFSRDQDTIMTMTSHEDIDCYAVETTLRVSPPISQFVVRWEDPLFMRDEDKNPQSLRGKSGAPRKWTEKDILDEMRVGEGWKASKLQKYMADEGGMSKGSFYSIWEKLKKGQKISVDQENLWYRGKPETPPSPESPISPNEPAEPIEPTQSKNDN
jgi:hypothetical protein